MTSMQEVFNNPTHPNRWVAGTELMDRLYYYEQLALILEYKLTKDKIDFKSQSSFSERYEAEQQAREYLAKFKLKSRTD